MKVLALICVLCSIACSTAFPTADVPAFPFAGPYTGMPVHGLNVPFGGMPSPVVSPYSGMHSGFIPSLPTAPMPVSPLSVDSLSVGQIPSFGVGGFLPPAHHIGGPVPGVL